VAPTTIAAAGARYNPAMGRYRPPRPKGTPLITAAGEARLRAELDRLWREERPRVAQAVQDAAKNGDRSENGDYIYGKKRLREIDSRVRFLSKRLEVLKVVAERPADTQCVYFGATVTVDDEQDGERTLTIVGPDEFEPGRGEISIDAPVARALLGKRVGDVVEVRSPAGARDVEVLAVAYADSAAASHHDKENRGP
jgi:transcription elongation factor GreB